MFHKIAAGARSYNLDRVLMGEAGVRSSFASHSKECDFAVVEGVMGLFDGKNFDLDNGSSAHLARILDLPVFLIVDAHGMAASALAHIKGYMDYDPDLKIAGIILNRVSSKGLYEYLKGPIESKLGIPCLGYLEKDQAIVLESRHLGLIPVEELEGFEDQLNRIADKIESNFDWACFDRALAPLKLDGEVLKAPKKWAQGLRIAIARDQAFNFYYQENLDLVESWGGEWVPCSPLKDAGLPNDVDALYLGGGFPEIFAEDLISNKSFVEDLKKKAGQGLPIYAECGGYIYLSQSIKKLDGRIVPMTGILPGQAEMTKRLQRFGYISCKWGKGQMPGHEFHRSQMIHQKPVDQLYQVTLLRDNIKKWTCGELQDNILAGYPHLHFANHPELLRAMLNRIYRERAKSHVHEES
jgi:cobyrinic acid a,c-diamide synthase